MEPGLLDVECEWPAAEQEKRAVIQLHKKLRDRAEEVEEHGNRLFIRQIRRKGQHLVVTVSHDIPKEQDLRPVFASSDERVRRVVEAFLQRHDIHCEMIRVVLGQGIDCEGPMFPGGKGKLAKWFRELFLSRGARSGPRIWGSFLSQIWGGRSVLVQLRNQLKQLSTGRKIFVGSMALGMVTLLAGLFAGTVAGGPLGLHPIVRYGIGGLLMLFGLGVVIGLYVHVLASKDSLDHPDLPAGLRQSK